MYAPTEFTGEQILQAFRHDAPSLFLGAVIVAAGLVAAAFWAIRRKHDPLLIYLALFAGLYGLRLWIKADLVSVVMHGSWLFGRVKYAIDFVIPLPAFLFFDAAGFLRRRAKIAGYVPEVVLTLLAFATLAVGPRDIFYQIAGVMIIVSLIILVARSIRTGSSDQDFVVIRRGLLIFVAFAIWENIRGVLGIRLPNIEA